MPRALLVVGRPDFFTPQPVGQNHDRFCVWARELRARPFQGRPCAREPKRTSARLGGAIARSDARKRKPTSSWWASASATATHWTGKPTGRQVAESPSRRAAEPPSAERASKRKETELASSARTPRTVPDAPREPVNAKSGQRRVPAFAFSRLSSPAHSRASWPFAMVARATQICSTRNRNNHDRNHPGGGRRATALARSDHPIATAESAPSVNLPPNSPHAVLQSPGDLDTSDTSASSRAQAQGLLLRRPARTMCTGR